MDWLNNFVDAVTDFTDDVVEDITVGIADTITWADNVWNDVSTTVTDWVAPIISDSETLWHNFTDPVIEWVSEKTDQVNQVLDNVSSLISDEIDQVTDNSKKVGDSVVDSVQPDPASAIQEAENAAAAVDELVIESSRKASSEAEAEADRITSLAGSGSRDVVTDITKWVTGILPDIDLPGFDVLLELIPGFEAILKPLIDGVISIGDRIDLIVNGMPGKEMVDLSQLAVKTAGIGFNIGQEFSEADGNAIASGAYDTLIASAATTGSLTGAPMGLLPVLMDAYSASLGQHVRNRASLISTPARIGVSELAAALWRGYIDSPAATRQAGEQGLDPDNFQIMVNLARQLLGANEVITLMLRSEISDGEATERLSHLGYDPDDVSHIKSLSQVIPGVQDLIRMAVREAFSPEIAEKFGQYEDYPQDLTKYAAKIGLSEDWAKRYWASHWDLPGANIGFEMLHRGVIDETELKMLLRALDVMPFWRDKLIQISYSPFTRVDIRRMHKLGILTDSEVKRAYQDIGYDDSKSDKLRDFTILLNTEEEKIERANDRDLTLSMIKTAYQDGMLNDSELVEMVNEVGYDSEETDLIIGIEKYKRELKIRRKEIEIIKARVMYGKIGLNAAIDQMNKIGLPEHEVRYQVLDLQLDLEKQDAKTEKAAEKKARAAVAKAAKG